MCTSICSMPMRWPSGPTSVWKTYTVQILQDGTLTCTCPAGKGGFMRSQRGYCLHINRLMLHCLAEAPPPCPRPCWPIGHNTHPRHGCNAVSRNASFGLCRHGIPWCTAWRCAALLRTDNLDDVAAIVTDAQRCASVLTTEGSFFPVQGRVRAYSADLPGSCDACGADKRAISGLAV